MLEWLRQEGGKFQLCNETTKQVILGVEITTVQRKLTEFDQLELQLKEY